jgi:hypothetical protein
MSLHVAHCSHGFPMLILRQVQIDVFEEHLFAALQARVERAIGATFPELSAPASSSDSNAEKAVPDQQVKAIVERGIERAAGLGIQEPADLAAFIALGLALGSAPTPLPAREWITEWLNRADTPGVMKLKIIEARLAESNAADPALDGIAKRVADARREASA